MFYAQSNVKADPLPREQKLRRLYGLYQANVILFCSILYLYIFYTRIYATAFVGGSCFCRQRCYQTISGGAIAKKTPQIIAASHMHIKTTYLLYAFGTYTGRVQMSCKRNTSHTRDNNAI